MTQVILVDTDDCELGVCEKMKAHREGLLHRAFSAFVFSQDRVTHAWSLLLQRRAAVKYHCANLWTNTCCSHPAPGESLLQAASNRLVYEMGLSANLRSVGVFRYHSELDHGMIEHEVDHVFIGVVDQAQAFAPSKDEVSSTRWITIPDLQSWLAQSPEAFTPWFIEALEIAWQGIHTLTQDDLNNFLEKEDEKSCI